MAVPINAGQILGDVSAAERIANGIGRRPRSNRTDVRDHGHDWRTAEELAKVMKSFLLLGAGLVLVLGLTGSGAFAAPSETCSGTPGPGCRISASVTVTGTCVVTGALTVNGYPTLVDGAVFVGLGPPIHVMAT